MEVEKIVFCEKVYHTNMGPVVQGQFEELKLAKLPGSYGTRLVLATLRVKQPLAETDVVIMLTVTSEGKEIFNHINTLLKVNASSEQIIPIEIGDMQRLVFEEAGTYIFNFYVEGALLYAKSLEIM